LPWHGHSDRDADYVTLNNTFFGGVSAGISTNCIQSLLITVGLGVMAVLGATASEWKVSTPDW